MKYLLYITILLISLPQITLAQTKPKRDTSRDRSVIVAKQKKEQTQKRTSLIAEQKRKQTKSRNGNRKRRKTQVIHAASYLKVNQLTSLSKVLGADGGTVSFDVVTDGKDWSIGNLPYWCKVTKYSSWFVVTYAPNPQHEERQDWFDVRCDNQQVRINISQRGTPIKFQAKFNYAYLLHNKKLPSVGNCLEITSNVSISGAAGQKCWVVAFILDENGNNVKAKNGYYNYTLPQSNGVYVAGEVIPSTDDDETFTIVSYIPNNVMNLLPGKSKLQCRLGIYCVKTEEYARDAVRTVKFRAKSKRGVVTTRYSK